ncbi:MAG TPA: glycosyl transferase [Pirellulaceae bacterium]|nr:glycosyl transferase [Pirellulaceae bacterium]
MPDFVQHGQVTTLHDLGTTDAEHLENVLTKATRRFKIGLVLPVTEGDMRADPFRNIVTKLKGVPFIDTVCVVLNRAPEVEAYREAREMVAQIGPRAEVVWGDGPRVTALYQQLIDSGLACGTPGKGRAVWTAFGYLMADPAIKAFALHDCDIVNYERSILARLCLPMAHPALDFEFSKAFYARVTDRMHGRVFRLLVAPLVRALLAVFGHDPFLTFLDGFRYPLSGEFAITERLARSNRIPSDWGLEVGTLAEVFRNTSVKRVCQVDLGIPYEHKHQTLSLEDPQKGLMKMATDILTSIFRTMSSRGTVITAAHVLTIRSAYVRAAQDAIRQYHADAVFNGLAYDRHSEEQAVEGFADQVTSAGEAIQGDPAGAEAIPTWSRVLAAAPEFPALLRDAARDDAREYCAAESAL